MPPASTPAATPNPASRKLRNALYYAHYSVWALLGVGAILSDVKGLGLTVGTLGIGSWALARRHRNRAKRSHRKLVLAVQAGDLTGARRHWQALQDALSPAQQQQAHNRLLETAVLILGEQWQDAQAIFENIPDDLPHGETTRSWRVRCLAELGQATRAIALAQEYLTASDSTPLRRAALLYSLGIAQLRAGMPESALRSLDEAATLLTDARIQAGYLLSRGDALRALGREAEAQAAWTSAIERAPKSAAAAKARARRGVAAPTAYR